MGLKVLLVATHHHGVLDDQVHHAVTAIKSLVKSFDVVVMGHKIKPIIAEAQRLDGVASIVAVENVLLKHQLAEPMVEVLHSIHADYDILVFTSNTTAKNILPRLAARCDISPITDVCEIISKNCYKRPIYAGNIIETVLTSQSKMILSIRAASYPKSALLEKDCGQVIHHACPELKCPSDYQRSKMNQLDRPELTAAKIVISGGRGLGSSKDFKLIYQLADELNAAVGASRAAVDAGFVSNDYQVGQTGKIIAPDVYVAVGISGAIQHVAGMKDSRVIIAINQDVDAPIFKISDYGLVGDLFDVLPKLVKHLQKRKQS